MTVYSQEADDKGQATAGGPAAISVVNLGPGELGVHLSRIHSPGEFMPVLPHERVTIRADYPGGVGLLVLQSADGTFAGWGIVGRSIKV